MILQTLKSPDRFVGTILTMQSRLANMLWTALSRQPSIVPDELARALAQHRDPTMQQIGTLLGSLTSELAVTCQSNEDLPGKVAQQSEEVHSRQAVRDLEEESRSEFH